MRSIGTQGRQGMGKMYGVGEEGEIPKEKSGVLDLTHEYLCGPPCAMYAMDHWVYLYLYLYYTLYMARRQCAGHWLGRMCDVRSYLLTSVLTACTLACE